MTPTVLITGSSSGIGRATASYFHRCGWNVVATRRSLPAPPHAGAPLGPPPDPPQRWLSLALDVTQPATIERAVDAAEARFGAIDVLVNNAGYGLTGPFEGCSEAQLRRQFDTNFFGALDVTRAVLPRMRRAGRGTIVNVSSIGGRLGFPLASAYHASKFALEGFSESLRFEAALHGIRVKLVEPGGVRTDFIGRSQEWATHPAYEAAVRRLRELTAKLDGRLPGPEGVAKVIFRAATDGSARLRYTALPGPYLLLNRWLPDGLWRRAVGAMLARHAGGEA